MVSPCAADLLEAGEDMDTALATVDRRATRLRGLLREATW